MDLVRRKGAEALIYRQRQAKGRVRLFLGTALLILFSISMCTGCSLVGGRTQEYSYIGEDVSSDLSKAQALTAKEDFRGALDLYLQAMKRNPKSMDARIGAVDCQIALGRYETALSDLRAAALLDPREGRVYDKYMEICRLTEDPGLVSELVRLAGENGQKSFLDQLPATPGFSLSPGKYGERKTLELISEDGSELYYSLENRDLGIQLSNIPYREKLTLCHGTTRVEAYAMKDGFPSEFAIGEYVLDYEPSEIRISDKAVEGIVRKELGIAEGELTNLDCERITSLDAKHLIQDTPQEEKILKIRKLSDLSLFPNLSSIHLPGQSEIRNFSPLKDCRNLRDLQLDDCGLKDISFLEDIASLKSLNLVGNSIGDASPVAGQGELDLLYIGDNEISNLADILKDSGIKTLQIDSDSLKDYEVLKTMPNLQALYLRGIRDADYDALGQMMGLKALSLDFGDKEHGEYNRKKIELEDLSFLDDLEQLTYLNLCGISEPEQLIHITKLQGLKELYLYNCRATRDKVALDLLRAALPDCIIKYSF
ncbi:MAG: tetratricopeptide repeat protein [Lachnospiraceae bacterium]|nr:tetratricopeptide repeat protein [Lachnospiraceae bacterium]